MSVGPETLSKLLGNLYDAAADPCLWVTFLQELARSTGASSSGLLMYDAAHQQYMPQDQSHMQGAEIDHGWSSLNR